MYVKYCLNADLHSPFPAVYKDFKLENGQMLFLRTIKRDKQYYCNPSACVLRLIIWRYYPSTQVSRVMGSVWCPYMCVCVCAYKKIVI